MRLLLDTHAAIWWWSDDPRLPESARSLVRNSATTVFVSAASAWEVATKSPLMIDQRHALKAGSYIAAHRDPFDRVLAAQSELDQLVLLSKDPAFEAFPVDTAW